MKGVTPIDRSAGRQLLLRAALCVGLLAVGLLAYGLQARAQGRVLNRDGVPQRGCRVEFFVNQNDPGPAASSYTDDNGYFFLNNPPAGSFWVRISLGGQYEWRNARISGEVIDPTPLIVGW